MLADYYALVDDLVRDREQVIKPTARDRALAAAVNRYSVDRPRLAVEDVITLAGGYFCPLPSAWVAGQSSLAELEIDFQSNLIRLIPGGQCAIYTMPAGLAQIRLPDSSPLRAGSIVRIRFTLPHSLSISSDTIPADARQAVAAYAAAMLCGELMAHYAADSDSTIQADAVAHGSKSDNWRKRQNDLKNEYFKWVGVIASNIILPASAHVPLSQRQRPGRNTLKGWL